MKGKRFAALIMSLALTVAAAGCGNSEKDNTGKADQNTTKSSTETSVRDTNAKDTAAEAPGSQADESKSEAPAPGAYNVTWDDTAEIVVSYPSMAALPTGIQAVEDAINEITEEEINTHVTLKMIEVGNYEQQTSLMISSNEQVDLAITLPGGPTSFSTRVSQNQLLDISQLLEDYAPTALNAAGDLVKGTQVNNLTYAFPTYKSYVSGIYIHMRTDVLEDLGLLEKAQNMTTFTEFGEIMEAVKNSEKWGSLAGIAGGVNGGILTNAINVVYTDKFSDCQFYDNLGNTQAIVYADDNSTEVHSTFASDGFRKNYDLVKGWYDKGYVYKDSVTNKEQAAELVKSNVAFSYTSLTEIGSEAAAEAKCGMPMTNVLVCKPPINTGSVTKFTWVVPTTAREPEAAVTFLEMMFTDERIANLFAWGIQDVDYELNADGVAQYIDGNDNPGYHGVAFLNPNKFIVYPWTGDDPDMNIITKQYMDDASFGTYLGFSADLSAVTEEVSAITNVISEYQAQVCTGAADEATYKTFLDKLESSGIDKIIAVYQEQLDDWLAQK